MPDLTTLQRQRRFLILMSLTVIAYYFLGATPNERAEYSGFGVTLANPKGVLTGLWVVWGWALLRYMQCSYERLSDLRRELLEDVAAEDQRIASKRALRIARAAAGAGKFDSHNRRNVTVESVKLLAAAGDARSPVFVLNRDGTRSYPRVGATVEFGTIEEPGRGTHQFQFEVSRSAVRWIRVRAWVYAMFGLPAFSEHIAPLLFALAVPLSALFFADAGDQLHADNIDRFWRVYAETELIAFDGEPGALDVSADAKALAESLRYKWCRPSLRSTLKRARPDGVDDQNNCEWEGASRWLRTTAMHPRPRRKSTNCEMRQLA